MVTSEPLFFFLPTIEQSCIPLSPYPPNPPPGQSTKACELFLKNRAAAVQTAIRQLRIEGATLLYIHKLCNIFFTSLLETAKEFEMDFAGNTGCYSAFVVWSRSAMRMFVSAFSKQVCGW